jgi:hypothetical protein
MYKRAAKQPVLNQLVVDAIGGWLKQLSSLGWHRCQETRGGGRQEGDAMGRIRVVIIDSIPLANLFLNTTNPSPDGMGE